MNQADYRKSRRKSAKNKKYSSHNVPYDFFANLPQNLADAPMIIDNGGKLTIITSYKMQDTKGNGSYVVAGVWKDNQMEDYIVNQIKSVYPWDDFAERIKTSAEKGNLITVNKNKAEQMLATIGIQPSEVSRIISLARDRVSQQGSDVKPKFSVSPVEKSDFDDATEKNSAVRNSATTGKKQYSLRDIDIDRVFIEYGNVAEENKKIDKWH